MPILTTYPRAGKIVGKDKMGSHTKNVLTVKSIASRRTAKLRDGGGLYLVTRGVNRYWVFQFTFAGRRREMGLGPLHSIGLAEARDKAEPARRLCFVSCFGKANGVQRAKSHLAAASGEGELEHPVSIYTTCYEIKTASVAQLCSSPRCDRFDGQNVFRMAPHFILSHNFSRSRVRGKNGHEKHQRQVTH